MTFGTALPFGFNSRQMNAWLRFGGGNELLNELLKNFNCVCRRQHRRADGWLAPKGAQDRR
jgi:TRAP-type mannitol/chloroaromatic compound transport system substrate-binding protein